MLNGVLLFSLLLVLFMGLTALFGTIHESHDTISINFYLNLQYFQQKVFSFSKISRSQIDSQSHIYRVRKFQLNLFWCVNQKPITTPLNHKSCSYQVSMQCICFFFSFLFYVMHYFKNYQDVMSLIIGRYSIIFL